MNSTAIIRTIGRVTVWDAIFSAMRENMPVIVIGEECELEHVPMPKPLQGKPFEDVRFYEMGKKWGEYGILSINVGAYFAKTEFISILDDDDELEEGAGNFIREKLRKHPEVDIWIPGIRYNDGRIACLDARNGISPGNVALPTYRTQVLAETPFHLQNLKPRDTQFSDYLHVLKCCKKTYQIDWFEEVLYLIRPHLSGMNGRGKEAWDKTTRKKLCSLPRERLANSPWNQALRPS